jgi:hypothetical protein
MLDIAQQLTQLVNALTVRLRLPSGVIAPGTVVPLEIVPPPEGLSVFDYRTLIASQKKGRSVSFLQSGPPKLTLPPQDPSLPDFSSLTEERTGLTLNDFSIKPPTSIPPSVATAELTQLIDEVFCRLPVHVKVTAKLTEVDGTDAMQQVMLLPGHKPGTAVLDPVGVLFEPPLVKPSNLAEPSNADPTAGSLYLDRILNLDIKLTTERAHCDPKNIKFVEAIESASQRHFEIPVKLEAIQLPTIGFFFRHKNFGTSDFFLVEATPNLPAHFQLETGAVLIFAEPTAGIIPCAMIEDDQGGERVGFIRESLLGSLLSLTGGVTPGAPYFDRIGVLAKALTILLNTLRGMVHFGAAAPRGGRIDLTNFVYEQTGFFDFDIDAENALSSAIVVGVSGGIRCYNDDDFTGKTFDIRLDAVGDPLASVAPRPAVLIPDFSLISTAIDGVEEISDPGHNYDNDLICLEYFPPA